MAKLMLICVSCDDSFEVSSEQAERIVDACDFGGHLCPDCQDASYGFLESEMEALFDEWGNTID